MHRERVSLSAYISIIRGGRRGQNYGDFCVPTDPRGLESLEREWNRGWRHFWCPFYKKVPFLANIEGCLNFLPFNHY